VSRRSLALVGAGLAALCWMVASAVAGDWSQYGFDSARSNASPAATGITAANVGHLRAQQVALPGTVDASPIYLHAVKVKGKQHDVFVMTTSYGRTIAIDAANGRALWTFTPPGYAGLAGSYRITNSTPIADPGRAFVYSEAPDGKVYKLSLATGRSVWSTSITRLPAREKLGTALNLVGDHLIATTGGYIGDQPPYQGHVVLIARSNGKVLSVWNSLCSDRHALIDPASCPESDSAIWARTGAVVDPVTGNLLVATGNAKFDGHTYWGDSVLMLSPDGKRLLQNWTPSNQAELNTDDVDLGSTAPAILPGRLAVQTGKDGLLRLLDLTRLNGHGGAGPTTGGELQTLPGPGGGVFTTPAVSGSWVYVTSFEATAAYRLTGRRLKLVWRHGTGGTSPVVAGGLLYVYNPDGGLNVYRPTTGGLVKTLAAPAGHWNSPVIADGRIALPEGSANDHATTGQLTIWRAPGKH
jgi:outer membrane protein assembly factor BamB